MALEPMPSGYKLYRGDPVLSKTRIPSAPAYPASVVTVYPELSGVNIRIVLFTSSQTYKFPDISIVIPDGSLKLAVRPGPSANSVAPLPAIVVTVYPDESGINMRIAELPPSDTYRFPELSNVIPFGKLNEADNPGPSVVPSDPSPAMVVTVYPDESGVNMRILWLILSQIYKFPDMSDLIPLGLPKLELEPLPSEDPVSPC